MVIIGPGAGGTGGGGGGNLQDSIDKLVEIITKDIATREKDRKKAKEEKEKNKLKGELAALGNKIAGLGDSLGNFLKPVEGFQANVRSLGLAFENETKLVMGGTLPMQTRMTATLAMLNTGLGDNQKVLGKYVVRSAALNENITLLTNSFRDVRNTLGLTTEELDTLGVSIANSAVTYNVATDRLAKTIGELSKRIAILGFTGAGQSFEAISEAAARTEMAVPGGLGQVLGPLLSGGMESIAAAQMTGLQDLGRRLVANQVTDSDEIFDAIRGAVDKIGSRLGGLTGQGPQVMNQILKDNYNLTFEQYNLMKSIADASEKTPTALQKIASNLAKAEGALTQTLPAIKEPLVQIAATTADFFSAYPGLYKGLIYVLTTGALAGFFTKLITSVATGFTILRTAIAAQGFTANLSRGLTSIPFIGSILALTLPFMVDAALSTSEEVKEMNAREKAKEREKIPPVDLNRQSRTLSVLSLGNILGNIQRTSMQADGDPQMDKQNALIETLLLTMQDSNVILSNINSKGSTSSRGLNIFTRE